MKWLETVKDVLFRPESFFKKMKAKGGYGDPTAFAAINLAISGLLMGLLSLNPLVAISVPIASVVLGILGLFIMAAIYHVLILIFGGKGDYEATYRVSAYTTALALIAWIPFINILAAIYAIYLYTVGFSHAHKISKLRSFVVVMIPMVIMWIIAVTFFAAIFGALAGYGFENIRS